MQITSSAFTHDSHIPEPYTCVGENVSPPLAFRDIPAAAQSLVLIVEDMDASPVPWVHWLVFNIPAKSTEVSAATIPAGGVEGHANGGTPVYEGPCPKFFSGIHHYHFRLFALDRTLDLPPTADKNRVMPAMKDAVIAEAELVGLYAGALNSQET